MKKISELSFGFSDAENYKRREAKEAFKKLFVQNDFLDEVCKPNISFLIGDKGTGKTAYSIFLSNNDYKNNLSTTKFVRETDYEKFIKLKEKNHIDFSDYGTIWKVILMLLLSYKIKEKENDFITKFKNYFKFKIIDQAIIEYSNNAFNPEFIQAMDIVDNANIAAEIIATQEAKISGSTEQQLKFQEQRFISNLYYIQKKFKEGFQGIKLNKNHILFIDGIDIRPHNIEFNEYINCIKGLANAVWELNNDFFPNIKGDGRIRIVLLVRPDIFSLLGLQNLNTKIKDNSVLLNWSTDYKTYRNSNLFKMTNSILNSQQDFKEVDYIWDKYFPFKIDSKNRKDNPFIFFLRYSYHRPRDIVTMLVLLKNHSKMNSDKEVFDLNDLKDILGEYSNYALGEIKDQFLFHYNEQEYEIFLKFFELLNGISKFSYNKFLETYEKYTNYLKSTYTNLPRFASSANGFLQFLFDLNIICYFDYPSDHSTPFIHWCFRDKNYSNPSPKVKEYTDYQIFYSLSKALKVGKEYSH